MVLEATMIVIDNSEYMRNGDYTPSRFSAQSDAVNLVFNAKTNSNPENSVGLMTMSGNTPEVKVTLTREFGKIIEALHKTKLNGQPHLATGIQIAQLALKHRQNKTQRQRIVLFVASPISEPSAELVKLAKKMKKNNVAVDFVNFGEFEGNTGTLEAFLQNVNSSDNSHLVTIPPGGYLLSDVLSRSAIVSDDAVGGSGSGGGGDGDAAMGGTSDGFEFGIDPNMDPDLAMALRMSLEEEQARVQEEARRKAAQEEAAGDSSAAAGKVVEDDNTGKADSGTTKEDKMDDS